VAEASIPSTRIPRAASSGAFAHFETHELIEASDLAGIAERARGITYQPPGA
jgi:hypothetical protein